MTYRLLLALVASLLVSGATNAAVARAAPPDNDSFAGAAEVASFPFQASVDLSEATTEPGEPFSCSSVRGDVWYRLTSPVARSVRVRLATPDGQLWGAAFRSNGGGLGGLSLHQCLYPNQDWMLSLAAGEAVYLQVSQGFFSFSSQVALSIEPLLPPANDDFAAARQLTSFPYADSVDTNGATVEPGEPSLCTPPASQKTVWYAYTPAKSHTVMARGGGEAPSGIAAYTGPALGSLTSLGCRYGFPLVLAVQEGTTYWFQLGSFDSYGRTLSFQLDEAPELQASFFPSPSDPASHELVTFIGQAYDPAGAPVSVRWDFGDGTTGEGPWGQHVYAADGDYDVTMVASAPDGRQKAYSATILVRTHDIAVLALAAPNAGKQGKTATITAMIGNTRYPEGRVLVRLLRSRPGTSFEQVAEYRFVDVPVLKARKGTAVSFPYTFSAEDAAAGKVTFQVLAVIEGARDSYFDDNTLTAPVTVVTH